MSLIKWEPFNELDRFFDDRLAHPLNTFPRLVSDLAVDVYEEDDNLIAKMSLPGVQEDEVDITIEDEVLTIAGRREEEQETSEKDYYSKEIRRGSFSRSVALPKSVEAEKAEATFADGMLTVRVPVVGGAKEKAVKVAIKK